MDKSKVVIMLDNGHGTDTKGKQVHKDGIDFYEYKFNRDVVELIMEKLLREGITYYLVVPEMVDIALLTRVKRCNEVYQQAKNAKKKAILISIHADAAGNGTSWANANGWAAWTTVGQTESDKVADKLYEAADVILPKAKRNIRKQRTDNDPDYESNFYILRNTNCPAVLVECGFYDNKEEVQWLLSDEGKEICANVIVEGIKKYIASL